MSRHVHDWPPVTGAPVPTDRPVKLVARTCGNTTVIGWYEIPSDEDMDAEI